MATTFAHELVEDVETTDASSDTKMTMIETKHDSNVTTTDTTTTTTTAATTPCPEWTREPRRPIRSCRACAQPCLKGDGALVRALGETYHYNCFICEDCHKLVASKFYALETKNEHVQRALILCEYHYYAHLGLICRHCDQPIQGPVSNDLRFHPQCLQCPDCVRLGKELGEPCFEYDGQAYCRYHFSMLRKTHCAGCDQAILKQFVEHHHYPGKKWHPECYMIQKFWNIRLCESYYHHEDPKLMDARQLQEVQVLVEKKVNRIWTDLSAFEESSATCISDMLLHVAAGAYVEGLRMAAQFVTHLEVLFSALDWINMALVDNGEVLQCISEPRAVCQQIIRFFHLLAYHDDMEQKDTCVTQELLSLVTGMAQNLKTLIRIGLTEALRLEGQHNVQDAVYRFLANLLLLEKKRVWMAGRYWFKDEPFFHSSSEGTISVDRCQRCFRAIDDECLKKGALRWHTSCFICTRCHRPLSKELQRARLSHHPSPSTATAAGTIVAITGEEECSNKDNNGGYLPQNQQQQTAVLLCNICCTDKRQQQALPAAAAAAAAATPTAADNTQVIAHISRLEQYLDHVKAALARLHALPSSTSNSTSNNNNNNAILSSVKEADESSKKVMLHEYETKLDADANRGKRQSSILRLMNRGGNGDGGTRRQSLFGSVHLTNVKRAKSTRDSSNENDNNNNNNNAHITPEATTSTSSAIRRVTSVREQSASPTTPTGGGGGRLGSLRRALSNNRKERRPLYDVFDRSNNNRRSMNNNGAGNRGVLIIGHPQQQQQQEQEEAPSSATAVVQRRTSLCSLDTSEGVSTPVGPPSPPDDSTSSSSNSIDTCQLAQLSAVQDTIVRHMAVLYLESIVHEFLSLDQLIAIVETKRTSLWYRLKAKVGASSSVAVGGCGGSNSGVTVPPATRPAAAAAAAATPNINSNHHHNSSNKHSEATSRSPVPASGGSSSSSSNSRKTFGVPLAILAARDKSTGSATAASLPCTNSMLASCFAPTAEIPVIVKNCILALLGMDMSLEGVFRKNGNIRELNEICDAIDQNSTSTTYLNESPIQLAALLKRYLRELPEPLLTFKLYNLLVTSTRMETESKTKTVLHLACCMLPKPNRDTMQLLFLFLKWVATFYETNRMDVTNLARVIAPTIFYSPTASKELAEERQRGAREEIRIVEMLIHYQEEFCKVPPNWIPFLHDPRTLESFTTTVSSRQTVRSLEQLIHPSSSSSPSDEHPPITPPTSPQSCNEPKQRNRRSWLLGRQ
ncbi:hypothetical protein BDB00DRAFT_878897 [Zychaea mexicana]|uniref:uncharacterized protein n=1 Tax=Zychaea mexicana TaxID=64656 RepID=UPI0022FF0E75|nr:uncharacterized protein BDB00DRAFT_878897 [Zychaea mexicana]KAI9484416.1 hypothetical protein BDB00DRAFT_878897 [Zychaea mexicana]